MSTLTEAIQAIAPTLATALGGPFAGAAVGILSKTFLGHSNGSTEDILKAISENGDTELKLKQAEYSFLEYKQAQQNQEQQAILNDVANARKMNVDLNQSQGSDWLGRNITHLMALFFNAGYFLIIWKILFSSALMKPDTDTISIIVGSLTAIEISILGYYFGTTISSSVKDNIISNFSKK